MSKPTTLDDLRRYAVARTLFKPTTLARAIDKLGFVQADPIRAPARAQDLILRHRVAGYHAGDLERRYTRLAIEEDAFVNYGFLPRRHLALMHPRTVAQAWTAATKRKAADVLAFIREHGPTHPRLVESHFAHGRRINAQVACSSAAAAAGPAPRKWIGVMSSRATTLNRFSPVRCGVVPLPGVA